MKPSRSRSVFVHEVVEYLGLSQDTVRSLRAEGLFEDEAVEVHEAEELRIAALLVDEMGVNAPGVHVALHLRRRLCALESRIMALASQLDRKRASPPNDPNEEK